MQSRKNKQMDRVNRTDENLGMVLLIVLALLVLLAIAAPILGVDSRPTGLHKWGDSTGTHPVTRF